MPDLTTAEMRARLEELRTLSSACRNGYGGTIGLSAYSDWVNSFQDNETWLLDLASAELARRERELEKFCSFCGHSEAYHYCSDNKCGFDYFTHLCRCPGFTDSPVTDGEDG